MKWINFFSWGFTESCLIFTDWKLHFYLKIVHTKLQNFNSLLRKMCLPLVQTE